MEDCGAPGHSVELGVNRRETASGRFLATAATARLGLRCSGQVIELLPGSNVVGRGRTCQLVIDDPAVRAHHLLFVVEADALVLRAVELTGDARVNGTAMRDGEQYWLEIGDVVSLGSEAIEVCRLADYVPSADAAQTESGGDGAPVAIASSLLERSELAERYSRLGQSTDAERNICPSLAGMLRYARSGRRPLEADVRLAAEWALRLAELNREGAWLSFVFELFCALGSVPEQAIVTRASVLAQRVAGISVTSYRAYTDRLAELESGFDSEQKRLSRGVRELENAVVGSFLAAVDASGR